MPDGEVTLAGAGHHAVSLSDVETARRASVLAYCARLCDPASIAEAADTAFAEFRSVLEAAGPDQVVDLDRALIEATRDAAAARVEPPEATGLVSRRSTSTCRVMPTLLAGRASERLSPTDRDGVERHLSRCARCRWVDQRREEAEQAYAALLGEPVPGTHATAEPEEPFAPGDPEPEVVATRSELAEVDEFAGDGDDVFEPEPEALAEDPVADEPADEEQADDEPEPEVAFDGWSAPAQPAARSDRRGRNVIVAILVVGFAFLAVGLVQILSGDDSSDSTRPAGADRPAAPAQTPAPAPTAAESGPSPAQQRTRDRLRSLGDRELGPGTTGADVKALQKLLGVQQTGNYGELTAYAVGQFQATHDLPSTGIADEATKRKLARRRRPPRNAPTPPAEPSDSAAPDTGTATPPDGSAATPPAPDAGATTPPPATGGGTTTPPSPGQ